MRNLSVINKSPDGRVRRKVINRPIKATIAKSGAIKPATQPFVENVQNIDLRARLYNPEAEIEARKIAAENAAKRGSFELATFREFVASHPIFSKLHLAVGEDEEE